MTERLGKIGYALMFCALLPCVLVIWAQQTESYISIPAPEIPGVGIALACTGFLLVTLAMWNLWSLGKGLPMNAYRPKNFVVHGLYQYMANPIYSGACFICLGISLYTQSASGVWLVTPVFVFSCVALVWGYEREATLAYYGVTEQRTRLSYTIPNDSKKPDIWARVSAYALVLIPWVFIYETVIFIGEPTFPISTYFNFELDIPVLPESEILYAGAYLFVGVCPLIARRNSVLRNFMYSGITAVTIGLLLLLVLPFTAQVKPVEEGGLLSQLLKFEQDIVNGAGAFPSFHVIWILISVRVWIHSFPTSRWVWILLALGMITSCITTGMHSVADVAAGACVAAIAHYRIWCWKKIQKISTHIFHSRKDWRMGPVRIINHSIYAALAAFAAAFIAGMFIHDSQTLLIIGISAVVGAGLWGQFLEGSSKLLRPFGYYGSVVGVLMACVVLHLTQTQHFFVSASAFAMAAPWAQAIGRVRCMVQGCCHGKKTSEFLGIKVHDDKSRICNLSNLKGVPVHNTQLYSILSNIVAGLILFRLWYGGMPAPFIAGMYLILNGLTRFVEEAYRGEVQTRIIAGLKVYQWLALVTVLLGMVFTTFPFEMYTMRGVVTSELLWISIALGLFTGFAMGVDFPESNRRFSRLSG